MSNMNWKPKMMSLAENNDEKKKLHPVLIIALVIALVLLAISGLFEEDTPKRAKQTATDDVSQSAEDYILQLEQRLEDTLQHIEGAGKVKVFITMENSGEKRLATDVKTQTDRETVTDAQEDYREQQERAVVLQDNDLGQVPFVIEEKVPTPAGVLVIAEGAGEERVKNELYEAVKALFGLSPHRIKICA